MTLVYKFLVRFLCHFLWLNFCGWHANKVGLTSCQYLAVLLLGTVATGPGKRNWLHGYGPWLFCMKPSVLLENIGWLQYFYIYPILFYFEFRSFPLATGYSFCLFQFCTSKTVNIFTASNNCCVQNFQISHNIEALNILLKLICLCWSACIVQISVFSRFAR